MSDSNRRFLTQSLSSMYVIVPVGIVCEGRKVRKVTGEKEYVVKREIKISGYGQSLRAATGVTFLCSEFGEIVAMADGTLVAMQLQYTDAHEFADEMMLWAPG